MSDLDLLKHIEKLWDAHNTSQKVVNEVLTLIIERIKKIEVALAMQSPQ